MSQAGVSANLMRYRSQDFSYLSGSTQMTDTDGRNFTWAVDGSYRVTQRQMSTGSTTLTTTAGWDSNNNLVFETDARGNRTDYQYDPYADLVAVAAPSVTSSAGTFRPTKFYSWDGYHNITAACDEIWSNANSKNWGPYQPTTSMLQCASGTGATIRTYSYPSQEPNGELTQVTTPRGAHEAIAYSPTAQVGTDYGLVTSILRDSEVQADGSSRQPSESFTYGAAGDLTSYDAGNGTSSMAYDAAGRLKTRTDADNVTEYFPIFQRWIPQFTRDGVATCGQRRDRLHLRW